MSDVRLKVVMDTLGHHYCDDPYYGCPLSEDREWRDEEKVCTCNLEGRAQAVLEALDRLAAGIADTETPPEGDR